MRPYLAKNWFALCAVTLATGQPACNTKAVGIEECRRIEYARCEAATNCPGQFEIGDVEQCKLFYRDHCLHGLPLASPPGANDVTSCVEAIHQLSDCAKDRGPSVAIADCGIESTKSKLSTACKLLGQPEAIPACSFLVGDSTATGGQGGSAGQSGTTLVSAGGAIAETTAAGGTAGIDSQASGTGGATDLFGFGGLTF